MQVPYDTVLDIRRVFGTSGKTIHVYTNKTGAQKYIALPINEEPTKRLKRSPGFSLAGKMDWNSGRIIKDGQFSAEAKPRHIKLWPIVKNTAMVLGALLTIFSIFIFALVAAIGGMSNAAKRR